MIKCFFFVPVRYSGPQLILGHLRLLQFFFFSTLPSPLFLSLARPPS